MKFGRIIVACEIEGVKYAAEQLVAFEDDVATALSVSGSVEIVETAPIFVEHDSNKASRGAE